jgi:hypothetical protein
MMAQKALIDPWIKNILKRSAAGVLSRRGGAAGGAAGGGRVAGHQADGLRHVQVPRRRRPVRGG